MSSRDGAIARAEAFVDDGRFEADLAARVAVPTESQVPAQFEQLGRYQRDLMAPAFEAMCRCASLYSLCTATGRASCMAA